MHTTLLIFFGVPALLLLAATGLFAAAARGRGGDPVAAATRRPRS